MTHTERAIAVAVAEHMGLTGLGIATGVGTAQLGLPPHRELPHTLEATIARPEGRDAPQGARAYEIAIVVREIPLVVRSS